MLDLLPISKKVLLLPQVFKHELNGLYPDHELGSMARLLMEDLREHDFSQILADNEAEWTTIQMNKISDVLAGLKKNEPFQYLLGYAYFMDLKFQVEPGVLIPRGETEELVNWILEDHQNDSGPGEKCRILDIGCGSGAIGITLARNIPESLVTCTDKYDTPIRVSGSNAILNQVSIEVRPMDALLPEPIWHEKSFDVVVSNPPYVTEQQKRLMSLNVLENEPSEALFVTDEDPLVFYRSIAIYANKVLPSSGKLYFEINEELASETKDMLKTYFDFVEIRQDIHGKDRMIKAHYES